MMSRIKDVLLIAFVTTLGVIVYRKYKGEKKSSFVQDLLKNFGKPVTQYTFTNTSSVPQEIALFDVFNMIKAKNSNIIIKPSMDFFNNTLIQEPKRIKTIKAVINNSSAYQVQVNQPMSKVCKDSSGNMSVENFSPEISSDQFQANMTMFYPNDLILDGYCVVKYILQPNSTVTLIFDYEK
jgi:hypothetical protein